MSCHVLGRAVVLLFALSFCSRAHSDEPKADQPPSAEGAAKPIRLVLPAGTRVTLPGLAGLPDKPKQTFKAFVVNYPVYNGPGKLKNYRLTIEVAAGKKIESAAKEYTLPSEAGAAKFHVEIPQGSTLVFDSIRLTPLDANHTLGLLPKPQVLELPAGIQFRAADEVKDIPAQPAAEKQGQ